MINALRSASTGMEAQQIRIDAIANDLANINTVAYKRSKEDFEDLYYDQIKTPGSFSNQSTESPTGIQVGHGTKLSSISKVFTAAETTQTGQNFDMAIEGNGFFKVTDSGGNILYTRNGAFVTNVDGNLATNDGKLLEPNITVPSDVLSVTIAKDGTVSVTQAGSETSTTLGQIELATFTNPAGLQYMGGNMYKETTASGTATTVVAGAEGSGEIAQGFLENSNVNIGESLIGMIVAQRSYEANAKVIEAADRMMQSVNNMA